MLGKIVNYRIYNVVFCIDMHQNISTDQVVAFVKLAQQGSIRAAAAELHISEQGLRSRLVTLENQIGVELYRKVRGIRSATPLTAQGKRLLPKAITFLEQAADLGGSFLQDAAKQEVAIVASQYLATYVLIDGVRRFHNAHPNIRVRLSVRTEFEVEAMLVQRPEIQIGFAAPYESSPTLHYEHLFSMGWSVVTSRKHRLAKKKRVKLKDLAEEPLIVYEAGSTGRRHVIEAFARQSIQPRIELEATTTDLLIRMAEADLGVAVVPLLPGGVVIKGRKVAVQPLGREIRPIDSDIVTRRHEKLSPGPAAFLAFIRAHAVA